MAACAQITPILTGSTFIVFANYLGATSVSAVAAIPVPRAYMIAVNKFVVVLLLRAHGLLSG